jgi:hypothetical protein
LQDKITKLRQKMKDLQEIKVQLQAQPDGQLSLTDPDARAMTTHSMKGTAMVGYNVQTVVDAQHHLIVAHEVTNTGSDRAQLSKMALAARRATEAPNLKVLADRGYYNSIEIKACECFPLGNCFIAYVGMGVTPDESGGITRPHIPFAQVFGWLHPKVTPVAFSFLDSLVMATHSFHPTEVAPNRQEINILYV